MDGENIAFADLLAENLGTGLIFLDRDGKIIHVNGHAEEIFGIRGDKVQGENFFSVTRERLQLSGEIGELVFKALMQRKPGSGWAKHPSHKGLYLNIAALPATFSGENRGIILGFNVDWRGMGSQELIERKNVAIDILHHDISNALTVIQGYVGSALEATEDEEIGDFLRTVLKYSKRIDEIMRNSIRLAKLENLENLEFQPIEINEILDGVMESYKILAREKDISFEKNLPEKSYIKANSIINEVFSNLISNAIKFSPEGSRVILRAEEEEEALVIKVIDSGPGVPDEHKEKIFERMVSGKKKGIAGTGLGLSIVESLVKLHNGEVWVEDNPQGGAIFVVRLPKPSAGKAGGKSEKNPSILIVDDDPEIRHLLKQIIDRSRYSIMEASSGEESLEIIKDKKPGLVFLDIMMPDLNGWEVSRKIKENPETRDIKVYMLTVKRSPSDIRKSLEYARADEHLTKPCSPEIIRNKVKSVLQIER